METTNFRAYWYKAIKTTPADENIHFTRVKEGEYYLVSKTDNPNFISITGKLFCKSNGFKEVINKHLHISLVKPFLQYIDLSECKNICPNN